MVRVEAASADHLEDDHIAARADRQARAAPHDIARGCGQRNRVSSAPICGVPEAHAAVLRGRGQPGPVGLKATALTVP